MTVILSLDVASNTGFAVFNVDEQFKIALLDSGDVSFPLNKKQHVGKRWLKAQTFFDDYIGGLKPDFVVYESVQRHVSTMSAHCYGYLSYTLLAACAKHGVEVRDMGVGVWKKIYCGRGNATKLEIEAAVKIDYPDLELLSDDHSDAIGIGRAFIKSMKLNAGQFGNNKTTTKHSLFPQKIKNKI